MYPIIKKEKLADKIYLMDVKAERVAKSAKPGQFVIVKIDEEGAVSYTHLFHWSFAISSIMKP